MGLARNPQVVSDVVAGKAVLVDPAGRELITLNSVGTLVWEALDGTRDRAELSRVVAARHPSTPAAQVDADVRAFLDELGGLGLLSESAPDPG
jgi:hypothetical protein